MLKLCAGKLDYGTVDFNDFLNTLAKMGITENEAKIYVFLLKKGPKTAKQLISTFSLSKQKVYRCLKLLQEKSFIQSTFDLPAQFIAVPFNEISRLWMEAKEQEMLLIKKTSVEICSNLKNINVTEPVDGIYRFTTIKGINYILSKAVSMANEAKSEILIMDDNVNSKAHDYTNSFLHLFKYRNHKVNCRYLTRITSEDKELIRYLYNKAIKGKPNCQGRHTNLPPKFFQRFSIYDNKQLLLSMDTWEEINSKYGQPVEKAIWTNSETLIRTLRTLFEEEWGKAEDIENKIKEIDGESIKNTHLKTGKMDKIGKIRIL